ncbi:MAG: hypothetical protein H7Y28_08050 [Rhodoferax sp.]|nr:hypothetical protein [Rhodoferax sp.]
MTSRTQRGQALTEFIVVAALFLVPLYLLIPVLGKYIDMKGAAVQGARYAAWERTVYFGGATSTDSWPGIDKTDAAIQNEVRKRVISHGTGIANDDGSVGGWGANGYRVMWRNRDGTVMLPAYNKVANAREQTESPGYANMALKVAVKVADALGPFQLELDGGLHAADVSVNASILPINFSWDGNVSKAFNPGPLGFSDHSVVLVNTWSANGRDHVKKQTQGLTPTGVFQTTAGEVILTLVKAAIGIAMPEIWFLELGKIEPDVVPEDRLTGSP